MSVRTSVRSNTFLTTVSALVMVTASVSGGRKLTARKFTASLSAMAVVVAGLTVGVAGPAQATTAIGDVGPGGGIVFITPSTLGNSTGKYFEAAPNTWDGSAPDGTARWCHVSNAPISGLGTAIGTGVTNSATIDTTCTSTGTDNAAKYVRAKTIGGLSDWFLPSQDEMLALYKEKAFLTGVYATNQAGDAWGYLTSSQGTNVSTNVSNATAVFMQGAPDAMPPGTTGDTSKSFDRSLRPVRMFEPAITPSVGTVSATANTVITPVTFTAAGFGSEIITYTVAPTLPTGLSLNAGTGEISGTPTVALAGADYVVTATGNGVTTATATINITVAAAASITPSVGTVSATANTVMTPVTFTAAEFGTEIITYTVAPTLPTGLSLNAGTGEISGTPTVALAGADYVVTATGNGVTTATATINITVKAAAITPGPVPTPATPTTPTTPTTPVTPAPPPTSPVTPVAPVALSRVQFMLGLTPTQVQGLTADELAALPPAAFAVMSPAQVKALNPAQMSGFSAAQIQAIPARSLRAMKPVTLTKFSVTQIRALTQEQASDLRVKQIKALGVAKRKIVKSNR